MLANPRDDRLDNALRNAFAAKRDDHFDTRNPLDVLTAIGERRSWTDANLMLMGR